MFGDLMNLESTLWNDFQRLQREMDEVFNRGWGRTSIRATTAGAFPAVNVGVTPDAVHVYAFAPGLDTSALDLSIERNLLTISGERQVAEPASETEASYYLREQYTGAFKRVISLPEGINPDQVNAVYRNGVLSITIGKQETAKPRQIQVNV